MSIGAAIKAARQAKGWDQGELASMVEVTRETVSRWETGRIPILRLTRIALEAVLGPLEGENPKTKAEKAR